jgi:hypothetical protein
MNPGSKEGRKIIIMAKMKDIFMLSTDINTYDGDKGCKTCDVNLATIRSFTLRYSASR